MDILKVPGKVRMKRIFFFARQFLYGNIESVWDSAVATNTFFQALFMEKSAWESAEVKNTETKLQRPCNSNKDHVICICLFHGN